MACMARTPGGPTWNNELFGALYGVLRFREGHVASRLAGTVIMLAGVMLLGWAG